MIPIDKVEVPEGGWGRPIGLKAEIQRLKDAKQFWVDVYLLAIESGDCSAFTAARVADDALSEYRERWQGEG